MTTIIKKTLNSLFIMHNAEGLEFRIKEVAKTKGITLKQIASEIGVVTNYISRIDNGHVNTSCDKIQKIADVLDCSVHELIKSEKGFGHFYIDGEYQGIRKA